MVGLIAFGKTASALAAFVKTGDVYCTEVQSVLTVQEDIEAILQEEYYKFNWDNDLQPAKDAWSEGTENTPVLLAAPLARETAEQDPKTIKLLETMTERYNLVIISAVLGQKDSEYALPAARTFREKGVKVCMVACFPPQTRRQKKEKRRRHKKRRSSGNLTGASSIWKKSAGETWKTKCRISKKFSWMIKHWQKSVCASESLGNLLSTAWRLPED